MKRKNIIILVLGILFLALVFWGVSMKKIHLKEKRIFSVELSDENYQLEYAHYHTGWWKENIFYAYLPGISYKKIYSGSIEKKEVELLIKTLDLKEKNLQKKLIVKETEDSNNYYNNSSEIKGIGSFLLFGQDTEKAVLIVTETGEIYLQGIYYSGDTTDFREAFYKFLQEETADNEKQQKKLLKCYADIVWE